MRGYKSKDPAEARRRSKLVYARSKKGKAKHRIWTLARMHERRAEWIAGQGGSCAMCGKTAPQVLRWEIDHKDPETKVYDTGGGFWHRRKEVRDVELAKCWLLCAKLEDGTLSCHRKKTNHDGSHSHYSHQVAGRDLMIEQPDGTYLPILEHYENLDRLREERPLNMFDEQTIIDLPDPEVPF